MGRQLCTWYARVPIRQYEYMWTPIAAPPPTHPFPAARVAVGGKGLWLGGGGVVCASRPLVVVVTRVKELGRSRGGGGGVGLEWVGGREAAAGVRRGGGAPGLGGLKRAASGGQILCVRV